MHPTAKKKDEGDAGARDDEQKNEAPREINRLEHQSSFSRALNTITNLPFSRRRAATVHPELASLNAASRPSRIPTPSNIPESSSFFTGLSAFSSKTASANDGGEASSSSRPAPSGRARKISDRLAQTPFFSYQEERLTLTPFSRKSNRDSNTQIEQRGLMAPLQPPLPRSSTMGNLGQRGQSQDSPRTPKTPSFMRPTSSSAARRSSLNTPKETIPPIPPMPTISPRKEKSRARRFTSFGTKIPARISINEPRMPSGLIPDLNVVPPSPLTHGLRPPPNSAATQESHSDAEEGHDPGHYHDEQPALPAVANLRADPEEENPGDEKSGTMASSSIESINNGTGELNAGEDKQESLVEEESREKEGELSTPVGLGLKSNSAKTSMSHGRNQLAPGKPQGWIDPGLEAPVVKKDDNDNTDADDAGVASKSDPSAPIDYSNPRLVHTAISPQEWLGRFTSLSDRFRTAALLPSPRNSPTSSSEKLTTTADNPMHDEARREKRVYAHLHSLCTTDEARTSLVEFKVVMENRKKARASGVKGKKVQEKHGFFQSLVGKKK